MGKILFWGFWAKKGLNWAQNKVFQAMCIELFWYFTLSYCSIKKWGKKLFWSFFWVKMGPKLVFFAWNNSSTKTENSIWFFLRKIMHWGFWEKSSPKWVFYEFYQLNFFYVLHKITALKRLKVGWSYFYRILFLGFLEQKSP